MKAQAEIRRMGVADLDQILAIADGLPEAPHWPRSAYLKALDPQATPRRIALVATGAGPDPILGFAVAGLLPPQAELETIAVARANQRMGLGGQLFKGLVAELKAAGVDEVLLEVRCLNHSALVFYEALGFHRAGVRSGYYTDPVEDAVLMRLPVV